MDGFARRKRTAPGIAWIAAGLLLAASALAVFPGGCRSGQAGAESAALTLSGPVVRFSDWVHGGVARVWEPLFESDRIAQENDRLRAELAAAQLEATAFRHERDSAFNRLALSEVPGGWQLRCVTAPVLAIGPDAPSKSLIIGLGSDDGLAPDMAVLSPPGVAGIVRRVTARQSLVQLAVDRRSQWGAMVGDSPGWPGILRGTGDWNRMVFEFENEAGDASPGDRIYTLGVAGSLFPGGLPLGEVTDVSHDKNGRRIAHIAPLARLATPGEVFVVLSAPERVDTQLVKK